MLHRSPDAFLRTCHGRTDKTTGRFEFANCRSDREQRFAVGLDEVIGSGDPALSLSLDSIMARGRPCPEVGTAKTGGCCDGECADPDLDRVSIHRP